MITSTRPILLRPVWWPLDPATEIIGLGDGQTVVRLPVDDRMKTAAVGGAVMVAAVDQQRYPQVDRFGHRRIRQQAPRGVDGVGTLFQPDPGFGPEVAGRENPHPNAAVEMEALKIAMSGRGGGITAQTVGIPQASSVEATANRLVRPTGSPTSKPRPEPACPATSNKGEGR
jgi:hypothetical protein